MSTIRDFLSIITTAKGMRHLSISPVGKGGWQVGVRFETEGGYRVAIQDDLEDAIREAFGLKVVNARPEADRSEPLILDEELDEESASLI
jgi:hypothetical protein